VTRDQMLRDLCRWQHEQEFISAHVFISDEEVSRRWHDALQAVPHFQCAHCGYESPKVPGRCPHCGGNSWQCMEPV